MESPNSLKGVIDLFADNELELIIVTMRDQAPDTLMDASQVIPIDIFRYFEDMAGTNAALVPSGDVDSWYDVKRVDIVEKLRLLWNTLLGHIALSASMALWYRESENIEDFIAELRSGDAAIVNCYLEFLAVPPRFFRDGKRVSKRQLDAIEYIKKEFPDVLLERAASPGA